VKAKQIRVDPQPEQFAFDVPAKLVRAGQKPRHAGVSRQRRAEASPLMRLDRAPQPDVVMNVLCPLEALDLFKDLPGEGPLFPYLSRVRAGDRATEFGQRCRQLGIKGVTLHSYRYVWAERTKTCGYPERFAQEALGHNSKAVHRAYPKKAKMKLPSLEEYEKRIVPLPSAVNQ
jgi:integrase